VTEPSTPPAETPVEPALPTSVELDHLDADLDRIDAELARPDEER
jgi:hypothetical protein